jgi:hypothetical protein
MREPGKVADLGDQSERGDRRDSAEARQDLHLPAPPLAARDLGQARVEQIELTLDTVGMDQQLLQRLLRERIIQALAREPRSVHLGPRGLPLAVDPPVPEQLLEHPVTRREPRAAEIITCPEQITEPLELRRRRVHEPQHPRAIQRDELLRVAAVGLHPVAGADRDQRRRDDIARHPEPGQQPPQREPASPAS